MASWFIVSPIPRFRQKVRCHLEESCAGPRHQFPCHPAQDGRGHGLLAHEAIHTANLTADRVQALALGSFGVGNVVGLVDSARSAD